MKIPDNRRLGWQWPRCESDSNLRRWGHIAACDLACWTTLVCRQHHFQSCFLGPENKMNIFYLYTVYIKFFVFMYNRYGLFRSCSWCVEICCESIKHSQYNLKQLQCLCTASQTQQKHSVVLFGVDLDFFWSWCLCRWHPPTLKKKNQW